MERKERSEASPGNDNGRVERRQIGGFSSVRVNRSSADDSNNNTVRRPIGGFRTVSNSRRHINDASFLSIQRPIGGFRTVRKNASSDSGSVVQRQIGGFTSARVNKDCGASDSNHRPIQRPIGGFSSKRGSEGTDNCETDDGRDGKRQKFSESPTDDSSSNHYQTSYEPYEHPYKDIYREARPNYQPNNFVTWNCNGFSTRAKYDRRSLEELVGLSNPEVLCIQEARLKADGNERGRPLKDKDYEHIQKALNGPFNEYVPFWSLAGKKYAGTLTLIHWRCIERAGFSHINDPNKICDARYDPDFVAFTPSSAIDLILRRLGKTREECGLEKEITKPSAVPSPKKKQQTSLKSFFSPKKTPAGASKIAKHEHHPEGRFQFFFFPGMDFVQVYAPNNGMKEESFERRRDWDNTMLQFVRERKQILQTLAREKGGKETDNRKKIDCSPERKLLWCGDMNVAATYRDGSHWEQRDKGEIYEWFRDEDKCLDFVQGRKRPENVGIPGFTIAERKRFAMFLEEGNFCDVWRELHPKGAPADPDETSPWERPNYTWRGALAKNFKGFAKYQGKGQRIDYFLLSPNTDVKGEVRNCDILGHGTKKEGLFCGSDHCAVELVFYYSGVFF